MCELCDIRKDTDEKWKELEFRTTQYQVELNAGRNKEGEKAKARAQELFDAVFENLNRFITLKKTMDETEGHMTPDLGELLRGKLN